MIFLSEEALEGSLGQRRLSSLDIVYEGAGLPSVSVDRWPNHKTRQPPADRLLSFVLRVWARGPAADLLELWRYRCAGMERRRCSVCSCIGCREQ
jgi:hypothetical protein